MLEDDLLVRCMMFPGFHCAGVLGAGLNCEGRDIHHLLAMTPVRSIPRMMCLQP